MSSDNADIKRMKESVKKDAAVYQKKKIEIMSELESDEEFINFINKYQEKIILYNTYCHFCCCEDCEEYQ